jgi:hypothetical protein
MPKKLEILISLWQDILEGLVGLCAVYCRFTEKNTSLFSFHQLIHTHGLDKDDFGDFGLFLWLVYTLLVGVDVHTSFITKNNIYFLKYLNNNRFLVLQRVNGQTIGSTDRLRPWDAVQLSREEKAVIQRSSTEFGQSQIFPEFRRKVQTVRGVKRAKESTFLHRIEVN